MSENNPEQVDPESKSETPPAALRLDPPEYDHIEHGDDKAGRDTYKGSD